MKYKPYEKYKNSGVGWLGDVPEGWKEKRVRYLVSINPSKNEISISEKKMQCSFLPMEKVAQNGKIDLSESRLIEDIYDSFTYFRNKDVLLAKITPCFENGKGALCKGLLNNLGFGTTEFHVLRANQNVSPRYVFYLNHSHHFRVFGESEMKGSAGQKRVPEDYIKNYKLCIPGLEEQTQIANFLDQETAKIDTLTQKQEQLITLLKEKRQAVISHAVTKGLNPDVPMKDSGVEWLGDVPGQWSLKPLKYMARIKNGKDYKELECLEDGYPVIGSGGPFTYATKYMYKGESVLLGRKGTIDKPLYVNSAFWTVDTMFYTLINKSAFPKYFYYCALTINFDFYSTNTAVPSMTQEDLGRHIFPYPPFEEQTQIANFLDQETAKIDALIEKSKKAIKLLKERRTALISAAVTGKIDVRHLVSAVDTYEIDKEAVAV